MISLTYFIISIMSGALDKLLFPNSNTILILIHMPARRPAQIGMKTSAAGFPVFWYNVFERDTLQSTVGGVARNSSVAKAVF